MESRQQLAKALHQGLAECLSLLERDENIVFRNLKIYQGKHSSLITGEDPTGYTQYFYVITREDESISVYAPYETNIFSVQIVYAMLANWIRGKKIV